MDRTLAIAATVAGSAAAAAYLDARFHISHDLSNAPFRNGPTEMAKYIEAREKEDKLLNIHVFEEQALHKNPDGDFLVFEGRTWTFRQFYRDIIKVSNWLLKDLDIQKNEIVAIDGLNSPEYILLWYGLEAIGAATAFINSNLSGKSLEHCIKLCDARYVISDSDIRHLIQPSESALSESNIRTVFYSRSFIEGLNDSTPIPRERTSGLERASIRYLIYTSGTTGFPKATKLTTERELGVGFTVSRYLRLTNKSRMYSCLPLFHGAAHGLCMTPAVHAGSCVVLGRKFSHNTFWPEVRASKANIIQYVGELCRYLLNGPPSPLDREHHVTMAWGNGMRPDVWGKFQDRFGIETINELYAATDGLGLSFNANRGEFGRNAIGVRGLLWHLAKRNYELRVKIDPDTQEMIRDENGYAVRAGTNEPGEVIHWLSEELLPVAWPGYYNNTEASDKRLIRNVFKPGDMYFRSGDMHRVDEDGRVFFVDRLGDTFRWHSENVSTSEVGDALGDFHQIAEANVYGVQVPHADGRCGAAAIVLKDGLAPEQLDTKALGAHVLNSLPRYAAPLFLRVTKAIDYTGTMKMQKGRLREEGCDLDRMTGEDKAFWLPPGANEYRMYGKNDWERVKSGEAKL